MRVKRVYAIALAGFAATAIGLALGYPTMFVLVIAFVVFGMAIWQMADSEDDRARFVFGGFVVGEVWTAWRWAETRWFGLVLALFVVTICGVLMERRLRQNERSS